MAAPLAALVLAALATSCWHPTFDPMLSASEATVRKLGDPTVYFTAESVQQWGMDNAWFLPPMVDAPTVGLLVMDMGARLSFRSIPSIDPVNHTGWVDTSTGAEFTNTMGDAYLVQAYPDGTPHAVIATSPVDGRIVMMAPLTPTGITLPTPTLESQFGIGAVAVSGVSQASIAGFAYDGSPRYQVFNTWTNGNPGFAASPAAFMFSLASQVAVPGKFLATTAWLYLSCGMSDGSRAIYRWPNPPLAIEATRYAEDFGPLIGALSDGRLLAEQDGIISVLDPDLNRLFKFPAGTLRFVHERYDDTDVPSQMKAVFTRTIFVKTSTHDDKGTLRVEIYEIPTANLASLAD